MSASSEKRCFIFGCSSTTSSTSSKIFVFVPQKPDRRRLWFAIARRTFVTSATYCCEDHFNLEDDAENWIQFKESDAKLRLKRDVVPHDNLHTPKSPSAKSQLTESSRKRKQQFRDRMRSLPKSYVCHPQSEGTSFDQRFEGQRHQNTPKSPSNRMQLSDSSREQKHQGDSDVTVTLDSLSMLSSPLEHQRQAISLSHEVLDTTTKENRPRSSRRKQLFSVLNDQDEPAAETPIFKFQPTSSTPPPIGNLDTTVLPMETQCENLLAVPLTEDENNFDEQIQNRHVPSSNPLPEESPPSSPCPTSPPSSHFSLEDYVESATDSEDDDMATEQLKSLSAKRQMLLLKAASRFYLGIPASEILIISSLSTASNVSERDLMLTIKKLRTNDVNIRLGHDFGISESRAGEIFRETLPLLSPWLLSFVYWPSAEDIRLRLPTQFRKRFQNVQSIIDCFEVEIEKPSDAKHQALTWSSYKKCNTVKLLLSCTPSGFINFVSKAYGGRITDNTICRESGYINLVPEGCAILADRGFKQIESDLTAKSCTLIRPVSVGADEQMTQDDVRSTRRIASVRIHVERVISRVREFRFLDIHARINNHLLDLVDHAVIVVCALVNLQGPLIIM